jgi:hypothetical protein
MTLEKADSIATHIENVFANKPGKDVFYRRSQLRGYTFIEIRRAFALVIAGRRQIVGDNPEMKEHSFKCAELTTHRVADIDEAFICVPEDEEIILVRDDYEFPRDIVIEIIKL